MVDGSDGRLGRETWTGAGKVEMLRSSSLTLYWCPMMHLVMHSDINNSSSSALKAPREFLATLRACR